MADEGVMNQPRESRCELLGVQVEQLSVNQAEVGPELFALRRRDPQRVQAIPRRGSSRARS